MRRRISVSLLAAAVATFAALGGCGVPADGDPQAIPRSDLPPDLLDPNPGSSSTLPESAGTTTVDVFLLEEFSDEVRLVAVKREVTQATVPNERLATLFGGATESEVEQGITSSIPRDTELLDVTTNPDQREVMIDLSDNIFTIEGEALAQAFAQMVWTATEQDAGGYRQVRFFVDGEPTTVLLGDGTETEEPVNRVDYERFEPDRG
jgi:spore germination protein GerM